MKHRFVSVTARMYVPGLTFHSTIVCGQQRILDLGSYSAQKGHQKFSQQL